MVDRNSDTDARFEGRLAAAMRQRQQMRSAALSAHFRDNLMAALPEQVPAAIPAPQPTSWRLWRWASCAAVGVVAAVLASVYTVASVQSWLVDWIEALAAGVSRLPEDVTYVAAEVHASLTATDLIALGLAAVTVVVMIACRPTPWATDVR